MSLWEMSIAGGVVILAVTAVRALTLDRLPKRTFTALWAVAVLRLLLPVSVPSPVSVYRLMAARPAAEEPAISEATAAPGQTALPEPVTPAEADAPSPAAPALSEDPAAEPERSIPWLTVLWAAGAIGCAAYFAAGYIAALGRFREAVEVQDPYVDRWRDSYGLRRRVSVRLSGRVKGPATYGLLRPVILLSADVDWHDRQKMWLILCHEYTHICRLDGLKKLILAAVTCLHWFNPLVWLMLLLADRDLELACDEQVLRAINGDGRADYARTLLDMADAGPTPAPLVSFFNKSALTERIRAIMKTRKPSFLAGAAGALLALAVTAVFACSAPAAKAANTAAAPTPAVHRVDYTPPSPSPAPADPAATARPRPTKDEVLAARKEALAGMAQADIDKLTSVITYQNQWWENEYLNDILTRLEDAEDLAWNYFDRTGEIEVSSEPCYSYHYEGELTDEQIAQVMEEEDLNYFEFCKKYGVFEEQDSFVTFNEYSVDEIVSMLADMRDTVQNEALRTDLTYLSRQIVLAQRTHNMWYASQMFKLLHDLDYYLLRYGPTDQPSTRPGERSIVGVYYGMLTILGADHGEGQDPDWQPADPPAASPTPAAHRLTAEDVAALNSPAPMLPDEKAFITEISREWVRMGYTALTYEEFAAQYDQPPAPLNGAPERYKNVGCVYVWSDPASPDDTMFVQLLYDWEGQSSIYVQQWRTDDGDSAEPFFYHTDSDEMGVPHRDLGGWYAWRAGLDGTAGGVSVNMQLRSVEDLGEENCRLTLLAIWNVIEEAFA